jgi:hypothetical protein
MPLFRAILKQLRPHKKAWAAAAFLPIPLLLALDPAINAEIACLYMGLAAGWLATQIVRAGGLPDSRAGWLSRTAANGVAVGANVTLFIGLGLLVGVQTNMPFPVMAVLSVIPAIGLVPWLTLRLRDPFIVLTLSALIVGMSKLAGCVVARIAYGPNYIAEGYVSDDWRTARLMITVFWTIATAISLGLLIYGFWQSKPRRAHPVR